MSCRTASGARGASRPSSQPIAAYQPAYDEAVGAFGTPGLADMLLLIGHFTTACGLVNAFDIPAPE
jgi:hypothetical protein